MFDLGREWLRLGYVNMAWLPEVEVERRDYSCNRAGNKDCEEDKELKGGLPAVETRLESAHLGQE